jgi:hypothetical protein
MDTIGSFAESLILQDIKEVKEGKALPPALRSASPEPDSKDIRSVEVPDSFMQEVLGEEYTPSLPLINEEKEEVEDPTPPSPSKTMDQLVEEFAGVVSQAQNILNEMTAVGSLGVAGIGAKHSDPFKEKKKKKNKDTLALLRKKIKKNAKRSKTS